MEKELALRTFAYLIGHYKTHEETIINSQEIEAINYILDENEKLEIQYKKQKEINKKAVEYIENETYYSAPSGKVSLNLQNDSYYKLLQILEDKEV
jgi:hypothetical protein